MNVAKSRSVQKQCKPGCEAPRLRPTRWCSLGSRIRRSIFGALVAIAAAGCATAPEVKPLEPLVFPPPPEEPRFYFERIIIGSADLKDSDSGSQLRYILTGERTSSIGFSKPFDVTVCQGIVFVSDTITRRVVVFDVPQRQFREIGTDAPGQLSKPMGLATDQDCNLYVADISLNRLMVYDRTGEFIRAEGGPEEFERLSHVAVEPDGSRVYLVDTGGVDTGRHRVRVMDLKEGRFLQDIGTRGTGPGEFNFPKDIELAPNGLLYVVDSANFRIQVFRRNGTFVRSFGDIGRQYGNFARPKGIAVDADGNVYVSDTAFGNYQIFDREGQLLLFVGSRSSSFDRATYMLPAGIDVDEDGRVYMVDQFFRKVDVYRPVGLGEQEGFLGSWNIALE